MKTNKIIGGILIVASLLLGGLGINKFSNSGESVDILGAEISVEDNNSRNSSYMYMGLALMSFLGGMYTMRKS